MFLFVLKKSWLIFTLEIMYKQLGASLFYFLKEDTSFWMEPAATSSYSYHKFDGTHSVCKYTYTSH